MRLAPQAHHRPSSSTQKRHPIDSESAKRGFWSCTIENDNIGQVNSNQYSIVSKQQLQPVAAVAAATAAIGEGQLIAP